MSHSTKLQAVLELVAGATGAEAAKFSLDGFEPTVSRIGAAFGRDWGFRAAPLVEQASIVSDPEVLRQITDVWVGSIAFVPLGGPSAEEGWIAVAHSSSIEFDQQTLATLQVCAGLIEQILDLQVELDRLDEASVALLQSQAALRAARERLTLINLKLARRASTDGLTGLTSRDEIQAIIDDFDAATDGPDTDLASAQCAILIFDLDGFKAVNDTHGHQVGDALLAAVGQRIQAGIRALDVAGRWGGDEFIVILAGPVSIADALVRTDQLRMSLDEPYLLQNGELAVTTSIGAAARVAEASMADTIAAADRAMYADKRQRYLAK